MFNKKKIAMGIVTALLLTGTLGLTAGATGAETKPSITEFKVQKTLVRDTNVKNYPDLEFTFEFEQLTTQAAIAEAIGSDSTVTNIAGDNLADMIASDSKPLGNVTISYTSDDKTNEKEAEVTKVDETTGKVITITKTTGLKDNAGNVLVASYYENAGFYVYKVTERAITLADPDDATVDVNKAITAYDELICSKAEYIMVIPVGWETEVGGNLEFIYSDAVILQTKADNGSDITPVKVETPDFRNTYQRNDEITTEGGDYGLEIKKLVEGQYASTDQEFEFSITIHPNATETNPSGYTAKVYDADGNDVAGKEYTVPFGTATSFTLKHGEELRFTKFPVGTTWEIAEETPENYEATAKITIGGTQDTTVYTETEFEAGTYTIKEGSNRADITNKTKEITVTGIVTDNLSFILLIVVAVAGIAAYTVMKRRIRNR